MTKTCLHCQSNFTITPSDLAFYDRVSPVIRGQKYPITPPTLCPDCRLQRRLTFRNERHIYSRQCDMCRKEIVSQFTPAAKKPVYCQECWWSDRWDPLEYGQEIDFSRSFFDQIHSLSNSVPAMSLSNKQSENSDYCNWAVANKNCYLSFAVSTCEDCHYSYWLQKSQNCIDCSYIDNCQLGYELLHCRDCYNTMFCQYCSGCSDTFFSANCTGCKNCLFCFNLNKGEYQIFNKKVSKEEFEKTKQHIFSSRSSLMEAQKRFRELLPTFPKRYAQIFNSENCAGDEMYNSKDVEGFNIVKANNLRFCSHGKGDTTDCYDLDYLYSLELAYEGVSVVGGQGLISCWACWDSSDALYSQFCNNSTNLFGCVSIKRKSYCILNKQYTKDQYEALIPRLIDSMKAHDEWGEFFPAHISPFGYNETAAQEYFPLTREQVINSSGHVVETQNFASLHEGTDDTRQDSVGDRHACPLQQGEIFNWNDYEPPKPAVTKIIPAVKLPHRIEDIPEEILDWAIECEITKKPFRIIKPELKFYREHHVPIPTKHPDQRHADRMALRNPRKLWKRECDCATPTHNHVVGAADLRPLQGNAGRCSNQFQSTYPPERKEAVYCEQCYLKEVY